jgi:uncharacterized membrane protein YozB (DUF420 family)
VERQYKNLGYFLLILVAFVAAGFYKPYFSLIPSFDASITPLVQTHAILLMSFVALLVVQPLLIRNRQRELHKSLGRLTYFLMPLLVASCVGVIFKEYDEAFSQSASAGFALRSIFSDAAQVFLLAGFYLLAVLHRRNVPVHMRYMIAVALIVAPAGIARVLGYWFEVPRYASGLASNALLDAIVIALILFDRRHHLNFRPYLLVLPLFVLSHAAFAFLGRPLTSP